MPARVFEVHAAPAEVGIDLALLFSGRICPIREPALLDAAEDLVELGLAHEEGVVLRLEGVLRFEEGEGHLVASLDIEERAEGHGFAQAEEAWVELGRRALVARGDRKSV